MVSGPDPPTVWRGPNSPTRPSPSNAISCLEHFEAILTHYGREPGPAASARKHLGWYLEHLPNGAAWRSRLLREEAPERVLAQLPELYGEAEALAADLREAA